MKNLIVNENKLNHTSGKRVETGIALQDPIEDPENDTQEMEVLNTPPMLIFIVEDNSMYAKSLEYYLKDRLPEADIRVFSQGESCIAQMHLNPYYIVMDYCLNSKDYNAADGLKTIREIRKNNLDSRIIVLSSQPNIEVTLEAIREYHCNYVVKNETAFEKVFNIIETKNNLFIY